MATVPNTGKMLENVSRMEEIVHKVEHELKEEAKRMPMDYDPDLAKTPSGNFILLEAYGNLVRAQAAVLEHMI